MNVHSSTLNLGQIELMLWLHVKANPSPEEWEQQIDKLRQLKLQRGGDMTRFRGLVVSDGGGPGPKERALIYREIFDKTPSRQAVVTIGVNNPLIRGLATAITWFHPGFKIFQASAVREALHHLEVSQHAEAIIAEFDKMQKNLPFIESLALARQALAEP